MSEHKPRKPMFDGADFLSGDLTSDSLGLARFYAWCWQAPEAERVRSLIPRLCHADPAQPLLILELLPDAAPLWRRY